MTPEEMRLRGIELLKAQMQPATRGVTLTSAPVDQGAVTLGGPPAPPAPPPAVVPPGEEPFRLDPAAMQRWREGAPLPSPVDKPIPSAVPPAAFPERGTAPIPSAPAPVVQAGGPSGITLNNTAPTPGWAGTIGMGVTPEEQKSFMAGQDYQKLMGGLDEIAKAAKGKDNKSSDMNTITPMSAAPMGGGGNANSAQLMAAILANARKGYGG